LHAEKPPRRDTDHGGLHAVDHEPLADDGRISMKPIGPRCPAQDRHRCTRGAERVVLGTEQPADGRRRAEHREVVADNVFAVDRVGVDAVRTEMETGRRHTDQIREHVGLIAKSLVVLPGVRVGRRLARIRVLAEELDEVARIPHWQRAEHQGVDQAEDGGVGADAQSEGEDGHRSETGRAAHHADGVTKILHG
jgi:hypothetical protein